MVFRGACLARPSELQSNRPVCSGAILALIIGMPRNISFRDACILQQASWSSGTRGTRGESARYPETDVVVMVLAVVLSSFRDDGMI